MLTRISDQSRLSVAGAFLLASLFVYGSGGCNRAPSSADGSPDGTAPQEQTVSFDGGDNSTTSAAGHETVAFNVQRVIYADVVAIDQPFMINRLGASQPAGMIFVLKDDLVPADEGEEMSQTNFRLRDGKRPRPIVLRMNVGDMLQINFDNWLLPLNPALPNSTPAQKKTEELSKLSFFKQNTRYTGIHVAGLELVESINSDGSWVGRNDRSLAEPGQSMTYKLYARETGTFLLTSAADTTVHQLNAGLFGAVNVQPTGAEWYRSQTTRCDMRAATLEVGELRTHEQTIRDYEEPIETEDAAQEPPEAQRSIAPGTTVERQAKTLRTRGSGVRAPVEAKVYVDEYEYVYSELHHPLINYHAVFKDTDDCPGAVEGKPILSMLRVTETEGAPKLTHDLQKDNYQTEIERLDNGFVTLSLKELFKEDPINVDLAPDASVARVANENRYSWVVTNPGEIATTPDVESGKTYLVQGDEEAWTVTIVECELHLVHSDLTAIITGPNAGIFPYSQDIPDFYTNPASPDRRQPYREFTIIYHQGGNVVQAFQPWSNNNLFRMINAGLDQFGINYGFAAIGPEIVANRLGVGPMGNSQQKVGPKISVGPGIEPQANQPNDAVDLKYEEFFLSSWCVGDPAMIVDFPANAQNQMVSNPDQGSEIIGKVEADPVKFDSFKPGTGQRPTKAFYPDDPSNVYHSYMRDHTKMRVLHAGPGPAHVHHLHAHQWLKSPNSPDSTYLDSQLILPGSAYTLEITYNGSGNRNQTVGDSIFHCHFYPHFAKGMWSLWRVHDTFEAGTKLDDNGVCVTGEPNRALPDGEIAAGTPTPAVIPMPTLGMAPMPAAVELTDLEPWYEQAGAGQGRRVHVIPKNWKLILKKFDYDNDGDLNDAERKAWEKAIKDAKYYNEQNNLKYGDAGYQWVWYALYDNPGYPFFIPGIGGHRPPHPPLDMAWKEDSRGRKSRWTDKRITDELGLDPSEAAVTAGEPQYLDGGLPRHLVLGGDIISQYQTRWDFTKDFIDHTGEVGTLFAFRLPEEGTPVERAAMRANAKRTHASRLPRTGDAGNFILNGLPPTHGAPYADPSVTDDGNSSGVARRYQAAVIQTDVVLNKKGWHYPQQRFITLWEDVANTIANVRPPQPFFIRTATNDATQLWHTNLVPNYYELDDFQVRTPTDVIGQHIHLVKFDVTASDGAANGFNYEDGTFGPQEVRERIHAITNAGGLYGFDPRTGFVNKGERKKVAIWPNKFAYPPRGNVGDTDHGLFGEPPPGQDWEGAMTTIQRWAIDPLLNWKGHDRTLRTVFTHDHFSPSTHQQIGLYAGVLVEPEGSHWYLPDGQPMNTRTDGGPTSWQAIIVTADPADTHREYAIEFQDMQLAYTKDSTPGPEGSNALFKPELKGDALTKMLEKVPDYDGAQENAPAAFYIGQATAEERTNLQLIIQNALNNEVLPPVFPEWFMRYGIQLDPNSTVAVLRPGGAGHINAQWLIQQPALDPANPKINAGDYYILQATNPGAQGTPNALSVFTPTIHRGFADPKHAVNPNSGSDRKVGSGVNTRFFGNIGTPEGGAQGETVSDEKFGNGAPFPSLVSTRANGTYSMNYRNEPVPLRVKSGADKQADLAYAFSSITRAEAALNQQPQSTVPLPGGTPIKPGSPYMFPPSLIPPDVPGGPQGTDPYTPLIRGYVGDDIQIRTLVGAHLQPHSFTIHGVKWEAQPSYANSGFRNVQGMGLSEHFEMRFKMPSAVAARTGTEMPGGADYFYSASTGSVGLANGLWGIMRSYDELVGAPPDPAAPPPSWKNEYLRPLVNNSETVGGELRPRPHAAINFKDEYDNAAKTREFVIHAVNQDIDYNPRETAKDPTGPYQGPQGIIFVLKQEGVNGNPPEDVPPSSRVEPLVLRAAAGEWIKVTLKNDYTPTEDKIAFPYGNNVPFNGLNNNVPPSDVSDPDLQPIGMNVSKQIGLHPQLVEFDATITNGINVGFNPDNTAGPKNSEHPDEITYYWYAGEFQRDEEGLVVCDEDGRVATTPIELGATNLVGADLMLQSSFGLVGALIIEPAGSSWEVDLEDGKPRPTFATVTTQDDREFRECVLVMQNIATGRPSAIAGVPGLHTILTPGREELPNQTGGRQRGFGAVNYRTEQFAARNIASTDQATPDKGFAEAFANTQVNADPAMGDPETPVFTAKAGTPTRFRVVMPATTSANSAAQPLVFAIHGHGWQFEPYVKRSTRIGDNKMSQFTGSQKVTITQKYDIVIDSAGGPFRVPGDYLYQGFNQEQKIGVWGLFRVTEP